MKRSIALCSLLSLSASLLACLGGEDTQGPDHGEAETTDSTSQEIAYNLGSALGAPVVTGGTCGAFNEYSPACTYSNASDHSYTWTAPSTGTFTFSTKGSAYDTVLLLRNNADGASLGCNDDVNGTAQSSLTVPLVAGQQITIAVDGYAADCGSYKLNISGSVPTSGLKLWLRTDAGVTASAGKVSSWQDQSGNGNTAAMSTAAAQPTLVSSALNGKPVVRFYGAQSLFLAQQLEPTHFTVFIVGKNNKASESYSMILGPGNSSPNNQLRWENGTQALFVGIGNSMPVITSTIGNTRVYHALSARYNGSTMSVYRDGSLASSHNFTTTGPWVLLQIGAWFSHYFMEGDLAEILVYESALSEGDRGAVNSYLRGKYALP
ncbi:LamG-like jellyroll fold domain-containing protein [Sorangium sp. So ce291]|uniref:LamG-like jellyroll fold domain-containing protein n=1 Tax=Sorangium sp. So ce291 TaxID=3133294 RepID=UPI003F604160